MIPKKEVPELSSHFMVRETTSYSEGVCPKSQSQEVAEAGLEPNLPDTRARSHNHYASPPPSRGAWRIEPEDKEKMEMLD